MKKKHRKQKRVVLLLILLLLVITIIGFFVLILMKESISTSDISDTTVITTEITTETETDISIVTKPLSYVEKCELDYVESPLKRTREEAIEKIKELSRWFPALYQVYLTEEQYPLELLLSGAGNPEMTDYLYGYLTSDGSTDGHFEDYEQPEDFPLFLQWDTRWGYMPYGSNGTVGSSGCGPTCLSMAVFYLTGNRECTPDVIAQYSLDNGYYIDTVGTAWALLDNYPTEFGLTVTHPSLVTSLRKDISLLYMDMTKMDIKSMIQNVYTVVVFHGPMSRFRMISNVFGQLDIKYSLVNGFS